MGGCDRMEYRILGALEVAAADGVRRTYRPRQNKVLAALLLAPNQAVPVSALIDAVWDDRPPATARRQIHNSVWSLRKHVPILAEGPGYRLPVGPGQLDAETFENLVSAAEDSARAGRANQAVDQLTAAAGLWRGPALAGCTSRALDAGAARLNERRLIAVERRLELELQLDRHDRVIGELAELVAAHPTRERLVGLLMRGLYAVGRQADALDAYLRLRDRLAEDMGIDPGEELGELHTAILRNKLTVRRADVVDCVVPRQLPPPVRHFVGRSKELARLSELLEEFAHPAGRVVICAIGGTAGVGKTVLALHWAHQVAPLFPDGQLYVNLRGFDPTGAPMNPADAIRGFLDALAVPASRIPASLEDQTALYRSVVADRRMLVVLDNARDADQVQPLLPGSSSMVVVTSRSRLSSLAAGGAQQIVLDVFTSVEAHELLASHLGPKRLAVDPAAAHQLIALCGRLPLALAIVMVRAGAQPSFPLSAYTAELGDASRRLDALDGGDPQTQLRAVFSWSYHQLGEAAAGLFRLLGLLPGPDVSVPAAASLAGVPAAQTRSTLDELVRAHLLVEHSPGRYTFHDLLRAYAAELVCATDLEPVRRAAVQRLLDHYVHSARAAAAVLNPMREPLAASLPAAAVTAEEPTEPGAALAWFTREHLILMSIVDWAEHDGFDEHVGHLAWAMVDYLHRQGHWHDWTATQRAALRAARRRRDGPGEARAHRSLGDGQARLGAFDEASTHYRQAQETYRRLGDAMGEAHTLLNHGVQFALQSRFDEAVALTRRALEQYRVASHREGQGRALNAIGWYAAQLGDHSASRSHCEQALEIFQSIGDRQGEAATWDSLGYAHHHLGDHERATACYRHAIDLYRIVGGRIYESNSLRRLAETSVAAGDISSAADSWREALSILEDLGHEDVPNVRAQLAALSSAERGS
jgi:DNA-binding SARP family transcriptional activator/tetratricopeptide (TPR) repeat protein